MRKIIDKKIYDTENALLLAEYRNGLNPSDFNYIIEQLYITKESKIFFLYGEGGPMTEYAVIKGNSSRGGKNIFPMDCDATYRWLEEHNEVEVIEEYFGDKIQNA